MFPKGGLVALLTPHQPSSAFTQPELSPDDTRTQLRIRKWILVYALFVFDSVGMPSSNDDEYRELEIGHPNIAIT